MNNSRLKENLDFYKANQNEFVEKYKGKFIALKNKTIIGVYASQEEAIRKTMTKHELGTFMIQEVQAGEDNYTATFYSRIGA